MTAYYNENDPKAAAWLKQLIKNGDIADGEVDERSITDVEPADVKGFTQCHWFAGIGGWSIALRIAGIPDHYPIWTGSCPCPPFSVAGKKKACPGCQSASLLPHPYRTGIFACCDCGHQWFADERHLWPEFHRLIKECRPAIVAGEQVAGADGETWLSGVRATLEILGYGVGAANIGAHSVGAYHQRQRLYWLAYSTMQGSLPVAQRAIHCREKSAGTWHVESQRHDSIISMADAYSRQCDGLSSSERCECDGTSSRWEQSDREFVCCRAASILADSNSPRQCQGHQGFTTMGYRTAARTDRCVIKLGNSTSHDQLRNGQSRPCYGRQIQTGGSSPSIQLENTDDPGFPQQCRQHDQPARPAEASGIEQPATAWAHADANHLDWRTPDWIYCRDEKWRPVEPGTFPLVDGLPKGVVHSGDPSAPIDADQTAEARVMRLRGYGNAIHPYLAAEFISAAMEAIMESVESC